MATVDSDGVQLAYEQAGDGVPVVGLHGLTATHRHVLMGSRALERSGHRVVLYDARGHGASAPANDPAQYGYAQLSADLAAVMDAGGLERAVLAGVSMGAHTLLRFALEHPERVAAIAVITPGYDPEERSDGAGFEHWDALAQGLRSKGIDGFVAGYDLERIPARWRATAETAIRQRLALHEHLDAVADALQTVPRSRPFEDLGRLAELDLPALVIASRDDADPGHPLALARRYADAIPGAQLLVEEPGASPLAWQGGRVSRLIAELAAR